MKDFKVKKSRKKSPCANVVYASGYDAIDAPLESTMGEMPYQEDIMRLFASVTDVNFGAADKIRRIVGKKYDLSNPHEAAVILATKKQWMDGCETKGIPEDVAETYWNKILANAGYSFNKSHAVAYSVITYETLWYYKHYPANYVAARLNTNPEEITHWTVKAADIGIEFVVPSVNYSDTIYVAKGNQVYMPLSSVKGLGMAAQNSILETRPYHTFQEFIEKVNRRVVNKTIITNLYLIGALRDITGDFEDLQTGNEITYLGDEVIVTDKKKKSEKRYKNIAYDLGVWIMPARLTKEVQRLSDYENGFVTNVGYGMTVKGKRRVEVYVNENKYPTFYIGEWEWDNIKPPNIGDFVAFKRRLDYNRYLSDLIDLTYLI